MDNFNPTFINMLKCPECSHETAFVGSITSMDNVMGKIKECHMCWLVDWHKLEPPSQYCPKCKKMVEKIQTYKIQISKKLPLDYKGLCDGHKTPSENPWIKGKQNETK